MVFSVIRRLRYIYGAPPMDNFIFQLCYRWTVLLLVLFSFIVTCRLLFGDSFHCLTDNDELPTRIANMKCYDDTVYTLPKKLIVEKDRVSSIDPSYENFRRYQSYYSLVNLLFLVQAFNFYLPHLLWEYYERGYMYKLTARVQKLLKDEDKRDRELSYLAHYIVMTKGNHRWYVITYISLETCNFVVSVAQTMWLVYFFDVTGVPDVMPYVVGTWSDFKNFYFPSEGICKLNKFSSSGSIMTITSVCQLPLNSMYMKMFLFLRTWYIMLTILCGLVLIYRILLSVSSFFRMFVTRLSSPLSGKMSVRIVISKMFYSDWFFLCRLQSAMAKIDFFHMMKKITVMLEDKELSSFPLNDV